MVPREVFHVSIKSRERGGGEKRFQGRGLALPVQRDILPQAPPRENFVSINVGKNFVLVLGGFLGHVPQKSVYSPRFVK